MTSAPLESDEQIVWQGTPSPLVDLPFFLLLLVGGVLATLGLLFLLPAAGDSVSGRTSTADLFQWVIAAVWIGIIGLALGRWISRRATKYLLTSERLRITTGVFSTTTEDMELRRVRDTGVTRPFMLRIVGLGNVRISSADPSNPRVALHAVRDPDTLQNTLRMLVESLIRRHGVREIDVM